jgi:hypothetical protein
VLVDGLVHDTSALTRGSASLAGRLEAHQSALDAPYGDLIGPLHVATSDVEQVRSIAPPDAGLPVVLVADQGLLALQEARHLIQDDVWLTLDHVEIPLPDGFDPAEATRALLNELAFSVQTLVTLPRTGYDTALDVLAADGVEGAAYRCAADDPEALPTTGELAAFVHACASRRVPFVVVGPDRALHAPASGTEGARHGVLNVLAAATAALDGATTNEVAQLIESDDAPLLVAAATRRPAREVRDLLRGVASADAGRVRDGLVGLDVLDAASA